MSLLPHLQCRPDQIAERVVLCGDPARVDRIAGPEQRKVRPGLLWALRKLAHVRSRDSKAREGASTIYVLRRPA